MSSASDQTDYCTAALDLHVDMSDTFKVKVKDESEICAVYPVSVTAD